MVSTRPISLCLSNNESEDMISPITNSDIIIENLLGMSESVLMILYVRIPNKQTT